MTIISNSLRRFAGLALLVASETLTLALAMTIPTPAAAQFFEFPFFEPRRRSYHPREQWNPWRQRHQPRRERSPGIDASSAPPPRKQDTTPTMRLVVMGDTMAEWLAYGLEEAFAETPEIGIIRKHRSVSGLIRSETRADAYDWSQAAREIVATEKPDFIVMMIGHADRTPIRERRAAAQQRQAGQRPGGQPAQTSATPSTPKAADPQTPPTETASEQRPGDNPPLEDRAATGASERVSGPVATYEFRSDKWAELYAKRVDETIASLKARGVPVFWIGLPAIRGTRATSDMIYLNEIFRARAEKAGIIYVDVWDGFVDEDDDYTPDGPDFEGQTRRLRTSDGVNFTKAGARKLAHYVEREIRRAMGARTTPVALPVPQESQQHPGSRTGTPATRPASGPVVPLATASEADSSGGLLGGGPSRSPGGDPIATRVLVKGEPVPAPRGRADDFAWPRRSGLPEPAPGAGNAGEPEPSSPSPAAATEPAAPPATAGQPPATAAPQKHTPKRSVRARGSNPSAGRERPQPPGLIPRGLWPFGSQRWF